MVSRRCHRVKKKVKLSSLLCDVEHEPAGQLCESWVVALRVLDNCDKCVLCASVFIRFRNSLYLCTPSKVNKRSRPYPSPNSAEEDGDLGLTANMQSEKIGDLTQERLISFFELLVRREAHKLGH